MKIILTLLFASICVFGCSGPVETETVTAAVQAAEEPADLSTLADEYLFLELSMALHDNAHVDAYIGPEAHKLRAEQEALPLEAISERATKLTHSIQSLPTDASDEMHSLRIKGLLLRLVALQTRIEMNQGVKIYFDEESQRLFEAIAPDFDNEYFEQVLARIDALIPGEAPLPERVNEFRKRLEIPADRLAVVFEAALDECRKRTLERIDLPENESFVIEYVTDKPWSGYNWYQGNAQSLIQVNTDLPKHINNAVSLGCHEGYPGHHTYNTLLEQDLVDDKGWGEFSLYPLFSPQSFIAEGSANYGIKMAFPGDERVEFERNVLFPLAGLDQADAERFYQLQELLSRLSYSLNEAARDYLNGNISAEEAQEWLVNFAMSTPERAEQNIAFADFYRSYVINYNYGEDMVAEFIEAGDADIDERWQRFIRLLSSPLSPSDIKVE